MTLTEITFDDLTRLEQLRNKRLRRFFAQSLLHCAFRRSCHNVLIIHCPEAWIVDRLVTELEELCSYAWLILGVKAIGLYFAQEEVCRIECGKVYADTHTCFQ